MNKKISLEGRKRTRELNQDHEDAAAYKKALLLSMKDEVSQNSAVEAVYQKEIKAAVRSLARKHQRLTEAGTSIRLAHSPYEQHKLFLQAMKELLEQRADFYASQGMDNEAILETCQAFIDDVREGLREIGIYTNGLKVTQKA